MFKSRFLWKLFAGYVTLILLVVSIVGALIAHRIRQGTREEIWESLRYDAVLLREIARPYFAIDDPEQLRGLQDRVRELGEEIAVRLTVVALDGQVLADSDHEPSDMDNHSRRPEIEAAVRIGFGRSSRYSDTLDETMQYYATAVKRGGEIIGSVRTAIPLGVIDRRLTELRNSVILGAVLAATVALLLGFEVTRKVTGPLRSIRELVESIGRGEFKRHALAGTDDEFGRLVEAFNSMAEQLDERMQTISRDRNKLVTILRGLVEGVVAVDLEEKIVHMNDVAGRLLGVSPERSVGRYMWEVIRVREISETLSRTLRDEVEVKAEVRLDGMQRDQVLDLVGSPLRDGENRLVGSVVLVNEVTELRRLEAVRRDFVANVSHELKTPITAIRGLAETLLEDVDMPSATRTRFLRKINNQAMRLSTLVSDLLTLARIESEEGGMEARTLDLRDIIRQAARPFLTSTEDLKVDLKLDIPTERIGVRGDEQALRMVVSNLLDNAIKYTPAGGKVWVRLRREGDTAIVEVQDTGIGIDPEQRDRIFERFYRVDKARSRELGGTGLGLSIVKHACLVHHGEVVVESQPGEGSTFRVKLPVH